VQHVTDAHAGEGDDPAEKRSDQLGSKVSSRESYALGTAGKNFAEKDRYSFLLLLQTQFSGLRSSENGEPSAMMRTNRAERRLTSAVGRSTRLVNPIEGEVKSAMSLPSSGMRSVCEKPPR
jgi:hypothetical protein